MGPFGGQAEKILRTLGGDQAACRDHEGSGLKTCASVTDKKQLENLCPACRVFGASGWRSPVEFTDFVIEENGKCREMTQQFVAIDRFTGGGAEGQKFDAQSAYRPTLSGTISLYVNRLNQVGAGEWGLGIIALALRDLMEGDIPLGFGAAKGYGAGWAEVGEKDLNSLIKPGWRNALAKQLQGNIE